jgi:hypothetical protein
MIPAGIATTIAHKNEAKANSRVAGTRSQTTVMAEVRKWMERPKSPWTAWLMNTPYWT